MACAHPDFRIGASLTPNDPLQGSLFGRHNTGQSGETARADINAAAAWEVPAGARNVVVALIDEGIDFRHLDLFANMWTNRIEIPGSGVDDDANGFIDDVHGFKLQQKGQRVLGGRSPPTPCPRRQPKPQRVT